MLAVCCFAGVLAASQTSRSEMTRCWSGGVDDLLRDMFLIMSNLIPLKTQSNRTCWRNSWNPICNLLPLTDMAGRALWLMRIMRLVALWLNTALSLPYLKRLCTRYKQCAPGITGHHSSRHGFSFPRLRWNARIVKDRAGQLRRKLFTHLMVCPPRPIRMVNLSGSSQTARGFSTFSWQWEIGLCCCFSLKTN